MRPNEAVVAGSPEFVDAMLPMFTERLGGAPRVADSPHLASALCQDGARLLVYEHGGREWLSLCAELRGATGPDLLVVVALPPEHAADVAQISASASAVVAWRGQVQPVLDAADASLAARDAPAPPPRRDRSRPDAAARPGRRPSVSHSARPRAAPPPRPVMTPSPRPAVTPSRRSPPSRPAADPSDAIFDEAGAVDAPASRPTARRRPALRPRRLPAARPVPPPSAPPAPLAVWPATVLSAVDGQAVVRAALSGLWPEQRLRATTEKVVDQPLHRREGRHARAEAPLRSRARPASRRAALAGGRGARHASRPGRAGGPGRHPAVLGGIDEVLGLLKAESDDASPEALRALEMVRHGLVKEAIDLTEALQQVLPADVVEEITTSRKARRAEPAPVTRMVAPRAGPRRASVRPAVGTRRRPRPRRRRRGRLPRVPIREPPAAGCADRDRRSVGNDGNGRAAGQDRGGPGRSEAGLRRRSRTSRTWSEPRETRSGR